MALPTFLIAGAPKAGTTAAWRWLTAHPEVFMSAYKEPHFFTKVPTEPAPGVRMVGPARDVTWDRGTEWYEGLFSEGAAFPARGEASTHYLGAPDAPELIATTVPDVKLVFFLRDPVERAYSHYWQDWKQGWSLPPFETILTDHPDLRYHAYMSEYATHLPRFQARFAADRILVVLSEDVRQQPAETFERLCRFIGVSDAHRPDFGAEHNPHFTPKSRVAQRVMSRTRHSRLKYAAPRPVRTAARRMRNWVESRNRATTAYPPLDKQVAQSLRDRFADTIEFVEELTRPLPEWKSSAE